MSREALPPIGREIADHIEAFERRRNGVDKGKARELAVGISEVILSVFAGQKVYFPSYPSRAQELAERNAEIRRKFTGSNIAELASEYELGYRQLWKIIHSRNTNGSTSS